MWPENKQGYGADDAAKGDALKTVRKIIIGTIILMVIFLLGGLVFAYFNNQGGVKPVETKKTPASASPSGDYAIKPTAPAANAKEGVAVYLATPAVRAGSNAEIQARTNAGSVCGITATYNNVPSRDSGLARKTADPYGIVDWTWTVEKSAPAGSWPVKVTCVYRGRSGVAVANLQVLR